MKEANKIFQNILLKNGEQDEYLSKTRKKHFKELPLGNMSIIFIIKNMQTINLNKSWLIYTTQNEAAAYFTSTFANENDMKFTWKLGK